MCLYLLQIKSFGGIRGPRRTQRGSERITNRDSDEPAVCAHRECGVAGTTTLLQFLSLIDLALPREVKRRAVPPNWAE